jgi:hypothetical protein
MSTPFFSPEVTTRNGAAGVRNLLIFLVNKALCFVLGWRYYPCSVLGKIRQVVQIINAGEC